MVTSSPSFARVKRVPGHDSRDPRCGVVAVDPLIEQDGSRHGSIPFGGTNSIVASSSILLSATSRTATGGAPWEGCGNEPYAASAAPPANTSLRPARRGQDVHGARASGPRTRAASARTRRSSDRLAGMGGSTGWETGTCPVIVPPTVMP